MGIYIILNNYQSYELNFSSSQFGLFYYNNFKNFELKNAKLLKF